MDGAKEGHAHDPQLRFVYRRCPPNPPRHAQGAGLSSARAWDWLARRARTRGEAGLPLAGFPVWGAGLGRCEGGARVPLPHPENGNGNGGGGEGGGVLLSVCPSVHPCVCPSICLSVCPCLRVPLPVCPCVPLSISVSLCPSLQPLSICPSVPLSICPSVPLSVCPQRLSPSLDPSTGSGVTAIDNKIERAMVRHRRG